MSKKFKVGSAGRFSKVEIDQRRSLQSEDCASADDAGTIEEKDDD